MENQIKTEEKIIKFKDKEYKIRTYIPIFEKMVIANEVANEISVIDEFGYINNNYLNIYKVFSLIVYYLSDYNFPTLSIEDESTKVKKDVFDLEEIYKIGTHDGLVEIIKDNLGEEEYWEFNDCITNAVHLNSNKIKSKNTDIQMALVGLVNAFSKKIENLDPDKFLKEANKIINKKNIDKVIKSAEDLGINMKN